jgi:hypothetical protein
LKKLSPDLIEKIADFEAESALSLRGYALEKDYFVTDVLALIRSMPPNPDLRHRKTTCGFVAGFADQWQLQGPH